MRAIADSPQNRAVGKNRTRAILFFLLAGVAGLAGIYLFTRYVNQVKSALPGKSDALLPVVVAKMDLPIATRLEENHLSLASWPKEFVPEGSFRTLNEVKGRTVRQAIVKGEVLLKQRLADAKEGQGMAALVLEGMRAMAVEVDAVVGVAGFVQPGDFVDVITTMTPDDETKESMENEAARVSKIILQNIKVLAVGEHLVTEGRKPVSVKVVTLEVTPEQSEKLALGSQHGRIQLTMRSRIDQKEELTAGVTPLKLLFPDGEVEEPPTKEAPAVYRKPSYKKQKEDKKDEAPVVEILRGNKIEERTLRTTD